MNATFQLPFGFDLAATFAFALTGALAAVKRGYDIVGLLSLALVSGIGGGLIGNWLINLLPFLSFLQEWGVIGSVLIGFIGAAIILAIAGLFKRG